MKSLRRQLLCWLLPVYLLAAVGTVLSTYIMYGSTVREFMDSQLLALVDSHATVGRVSALRPLSPQHVQKGYPVVQIWDDGGRLLATSHPQLAMPMRSSGLHDVTLGARSWRVYALRTPDRTVQSVQSLDFRDHVIREQAVQAGLRVALLIPISVAILWLAIRAAVRRLETVARNVAAQDERSFGDLPFEQVPTEIRPLVLAVNSLLARLREAFTSQQRFIQDAAHELRTPMTALSLQFDNLKRRLTDHAVAAEVAQLEQGLARTRRLVEQMLRLTRQEARPRSEANIVQLDEFVRTVVLDLMPLADHRNIDLGLLVDLPMSVRVNADDLRSLLHNLLDNALRHTPTGGVVDVLLREQAGTSVIEIVDSGPGISPELLPRVFDRFFRVEGSDTEGSGLGLAIAQSAALRNGIELDLSNRTDRSGLIARVMLPVALRVETFAHTSSQRPAASIVPSAPLST